MKPLSFISTALCALFMGAAMAAPKSQALRPPRVRQEEHQEREHQEWVGRCLREMQTVTPGMTRAALEKVFVGEGGLYTSARQTYVYRGCPYFKVVVVFKLAGSGLEMPSNPKDRIVSITEPYVNAVSQPN